MGNGCFSVYTLAFSLLLLFIHIWISFYFDTFGVTWPLFAIEGTVLGGWLSTTCRWKEEVCSSNDVDIYDLLPSEHESVDRWELPPAASSALPTQLTNTRLLRPWTQTRRR